jgi:hypothetical protein
MLVCRKSGPSALHVPVLLLGGVFAVTWALVQGGPERASGGSVGLGVLDGIIALVALTQFRLLEARGRTLRVRRVFKTETFERSAAAFGVRRENHAKSTEYVVFVTDGLRHSDVAFCATDAGAKRVVRRLNDALLDGGPSPNASGSLELQRLDARFRRSVERTQHIVADFYASSEWRRARLLIAIVGAAVIAVAGFCWYRAQVRP